MPCIPRTSRWEAHHSDEGVFFHNNSTGETRWTHPTKGTLPELVPQQTKPVAGGGDVAVEESTAAIAGSNSEAQPAQRRKHQTQRTGIIHDVDDELANPQRTGITHDVDDELEIHFEGSKPMAGGGDAAVEESTAAISGSNPMVAAAP